MKLNDIDFKRLLPEFMRNDKFDAILAGATSEFFQKASIDMQRVVIVGQTASLNEAELDQIAKDSNIFWYMKSADIDTKRQVIDDAPLVFKRLGTVWAVEKVMNSYLAGCELIEWFEADDLEHDYFRFRTSDISILRSDIKTFLNILEKVKRKSQWLESIILQLKALGTVYSACGIYERNVETYKFLLEDAVLTEE